MTDETEPEMPVIFLTPNSKFVKEDDTDAPYKLSAVPKADLEALVEQWEDNNTTPCQACAQELREVLEQYE